MIGKSIEKKAREKANENNESRSTLVGRSERIERLMIAVAGSANKKAITIERRSTMDFFIKTVRNIRAKKIENENREIDCPIDCIEEGNRQSKITVDDITTYNKIDLRERPLSIQKNPPRNSQKCF